MQYKIIKIEVTGLFGKTINAENVLNEMAQSGWRLVAVVPMVGIRMTFISSTVGYFYHFERVI